ncbi:hypothetical protein [Aminicella lysinilytica]|uniref:hypothetical protein n=1 Tax=Aminicella lysinilytica TaxID=433323 RepID=UPI0026F273E7|nr:hypothetical protein [Aminicella lysinilytica]
MKKLATLIITVALVAVMMPLGMENSYAMSEGTYSGRAVTSNPVVATQINKIEKKYPNHRYYSGGGQCWGYAEKVSTTLSTRKSAGYYSYLRFNTSNFLKKCEGVKAGTHLRLSRSGKFSGYYGHSVVLLSVTKSKVYWADNNYYASNKVCYYQGTPSQFVKFYVSNSGYKYINMVKKANKYKACKIIKVKSAADVTDKAIDVSWGKLSGSSKYYVYRSYTGTHGSYEKIATTKSTTYADTKVAEGNSAYYKVTAVKSSGNVYSNAAVSTLDTAETAQTAQ